MILRSLVSFSQRDYFSSSFLAVTVSNPFLRRIRQLMYSRRSRVLFAGDWRIRGHIVLAGCQFPRRRGQYLPNPTSPALELTRIHSQR